MLTEAEAKTKWCPMTRLIAGSDGDGAPAGAPSSYNRALTGVLNQAKCIGSDCMMWRWWVDPVETAARIETDLAANRGLRPTGYCGLAR